MWLKVDHDSPCVEARAATKLPIIRIYAAAVVRRTWLPLARPTVMASAIACSSYMLHDLCLTQANPVSKHSAASKGCQLMQVNNNHHEESMMYATASMCTCCPSLESSKRFVGSLRKHAA
eukprot:919190-Amphidinium_carterae.2